MLSLIKLFLCGLCDLCILQKMNTCNPILVPMLCEQALILNAKMDDIFDFKASSDWLKNFKSRHSILVRELNTEGEIFSWNYKSAKKFKGIFVNMI